MRKWAALTPPVEYNGRNIRKIMIYQTPERGTCVFLYAEKDAKISCADEWYPTLPEALAAWECAAHSEWKQIADPLPGCQEDAFETIRVKGRETGKPEWGKYEILRDGEWRTYDPAQTESENADFIV